MTRTLPKSRLGLLGLALLLSALIVIVGNAAVDLALGRVPFAHGRLAAFDVVLMQIAFLSIPFVVLALVRSRSRTLWSLALVFTCLFQAYFIWQVWRDSLAGFAGANIGLGLVILSSPIAILLGLGLAAAVRAVARW